MNRKNKFHDFYEPGIRLLFIDCLLNAGWNHERLSAPFWRLYWNDRPGSYVSLQGRQTELTPDKIMVIPPNTAYKSRVVTPAQHFHVHFVVKPPYNSIIDRIFTFPVDADILNTIAACSELLEKQRYDSFRLVFLCQKLICTVLARLPEKELKNPYTDTRVRKVAQYIDNSLQEKLKNKDFAKVAGMHSGAINRLFKSQTGMTPLEYQQLQRIEKVCVLLQFSDKSIEQIAEETGFYDRFHLSRVFKNLRGVNPARYRSFIN